MEAVPQITAPATEPLSGLLITSLLGRAAEARLILYVRDKEAQMPESKSFIGALAIVWIVSACASPAKVANMTPADIAITKKHPYTVSTRVVGGEETSSLGMSKVSATGFQEALADAIIESGVFYNVVSIGG